MNKNRLVLGLFGITLAAFFFINALTYPEAAAQMPLIYSVIVALLSLAMVGSELLSWRTEHGTHFDQQMAVTEREPVRSRYGATAIVFLLAIIYVAVIDTLGYLLSTVLFIALVLSVIRTVSVRFAVAGTVVLVVVICLVFIEFLGLPVPLLPSVIF